MALTNLNDIEVIFLLWFIVFLNKLFYFTNFKPNKNGVKIMPNISVV